MRNEPLWKYIRDNTRVPSLVMGDLEAQIAAAELGVQRFAQLMETYGKNTVLAASRQLMDYTEAMLRREIAKIPDGDYVAEGFLDDDGRTRGVTLPPVVVLQNGQMSATFAPEHGMLVVHSDSDDEVWDAVARVTYNQVVHVYYNGRLERYLEWAEQAA